MAGEDGRMAGDGGLGSDGGDAARVDAGLADTTTGTRQEGAGPGSEGAGPGGGLGPLAPEPPAPLPSEAPSSEVAFSDAPSSEAPFSEVPASQAAASGAPGSEAFTSGVPGSQAPGPQTAGPGGDAGGMERHEQLLTGAELDGIMVRWHEIQAGFVEEPRRAISEADALVTELIDRLTQMFAREREQLQAQCGAGNDVSTEDLRQGLRRYRTFFERLLAI